jgi:8-oxo-dGTP pyrophosphatase MutT (NUDIX family)
MSSPAKQVFLRDLQCYAAGLATAEKATADRMADFVQAFAEPFSRDTSAGHVTASAWILNTERSHVLLCHHRKLDMWIQLGGHLEPADESVFAAALREAYEESGLKSLMPLSSAIFDIDIHAIPAIGSDPAHDHYDVRYAFIAEGSNEFARNEESKGLAWVPLDQITSVSDELSLRRMADKTPGLLGRLP